MTTRNNPADQPIRIGISTCLLGEGVRYDGGHKKDRFITEILAPFVTFVPVCPEIDVGMGVPREAVRLVGDPIAPRMVGRKTGKDWTQRMNTYARSRARQLARKKLSGYIFKRASPSCGFERVRVYSEAGQPGRVGSGLFAKAVVDHFPYLPVEDEGRLNDAGLRENFIERVFAYHRLQRLFDGRTSRRAIVDFHTAHKYLLLAHSPKHYKLLGQLVAKVANYSPAAFRETYNKLFMETMKVKTTANKNANVLQHIMGYLKKHLTAGEKQYLLEVIADYKNGLVPVIGPITLVKQYIHKFEISYIANQNYLNPHPKEMMLRNHV